MMGVMRQVIAVMKAQERPQQLRIDVLAPITLITPGTFIPSPKRKPRGTCAPRGFHQRF